MVAVGSRRQQQGMRIALWTLCECLVICNFCCVGALAETVEVEVGGLADDLEKNVLAYLSIADLGKEGAEASQPVTESNVRRLHGAARMEIERALQPFGYYEPTIRSTLQRADDGWLARYDVDPGAPTVVDLVEIRAVGDGGEEPAVREALGSADVCAGRSAAAHEVRSRETAALRRGPRRGLHRRRLSSEHRSACGARNARPTSS